MIKIFNFHEKLACKAIEVEMYYVEKHWNLFEIYFGLTNHCDHAGLKFNFEILGLCFSFNIYDRRHWNYETNTWEIHKQR